MRVIKTTDGQHLGRDIPEVNTGDTLEFDGFVFQVQKKTVLENGHILLSNFNYQLICEE